MLENRDQESQQEFFGEFSKQAERPERLPALAKSQKPVLISATSEHILVACILLILAFCAVFFLGVMRGKSLARLEPAPVKTVLPVPATAPKPVSAAVAPPRPRVVVADPAKPYTIQLVTHKKRDYAESEIRLLKQKGLSAFILSSGDYFLVCYGQYENKEGAKKDLAAFRGRYKDCFLSPVLRSKK